MQDEWPTERSFTQYSAYTIHMRSSAEAPSRHAQYRATLVKDPNTARTEAEEAVLDEEVDTAWIAALNAPEQVAYEAALSELGEGEWASGSEMELEDTAASEAEEDTAMEMENAAGKVADAAGMLLGAAHTMDETPMPIRLKATQEPDLSQNEKQNKKYTGRVKALDYLTKRWGRDISTWIPADTSNQSDKFRSPNKWPAGVIEGLARLAKLTTTTSKRQQAMKFLEGIVWERIKNVPRQVKKDEVWRAVQRAREAWGPVSDAQANGDTVEYVPYEHPVDQHDPSAEEVDVLGVDDDTLKMDSWTLRVELTKARKRLRQLEQLQAK
ncbi:hypothetical protein DIS24_g10986 [Lasiodiplodia hormozganensis]|uniref:Uncharacterized protein n=1 Tax=Lasiodiplodia hormozganensis TaxID=869390 RepID=A0AA40C522_9PEZI|nr:hypothetical protein DIS24_g10986 [Lasiodiplodia hormozganensis]